jgi:hypothetical protein
MKLELKHLAPYLPYELKMYCEQDKTKHTLTIAHQTFDLKSVGLNPILKDEFFKTFKPILKLLSDITESEMIKMLVIGNPYFKGKTISVNWLNNEILDFNCNGGDNQFVITHDLRGVAAFNIQSIDNKKVVNSHFENHIGVYTFLLENHYDVFGLIQADLAIDTNTLK